MATDCVYDFSCLYHIGDDLAAAFNSGYQQGLSDARAERKTGKWIYKSLSFVGIYICSNCGESNYTERTKYCPNCGARMVTDDV